MKESEAETLTTEVKKVVLDSGADLVGIVKPCVIDALLKYGLVGQFKNIPRKPWTSYQTPSP